MRPGNCSGSYSEPPRARAIALRSSSRPREVDATTFSIRKLAMGSLRGGPCMQSRSDGTGHNWWLICFGATATPRQTGTDLGKRVAAAGPQDLAVSNENGLPVPRDGPAMDANQARERATHPKPTVLSDFILGSQDGIVNVLGIILGLSAATRDVRIILVATLAALGAGAIAVGAVAYTSTRARRRLYLSQALQERRGVEGKPPTEPGEVRESPNGGGQQGAGLGEIVGRICRNPTAELEFLMSLELKLSPLRAGAPRARAV